MNKRANILDKMLVMFSFMILLFGIIALNMAWEPTYAALNESLNNTQVQSMLANYDPAGLSNWMDWMIVLFYFAINILVCIVLPLMLEHNPVMIAFFFIFSFIWTFIVAILANVIVETVSDLTTAFPYTLLLVKFIVEIEVIFMFVLVGIMFFKSRSGQAQTGGGGYY